MADRSNGGRRDGRNKRPVQNPEISANAESLRVVVPSYADFAAQSTAISRAAHSLPLMLRRLVYLTVATARPHSSGTFSACMLVPDVANALGLTRGGEQYAAIRKAVLDSSEALLKHVIRITEPDGSWLAYQWFSRVSYHAEQDAVEIHLHPELSPYLNQLETAYSVFSIRDVSQFTNKYALRLFELALSWQGMSGKHGNKPGEWYFEYEMSELKFLFQVDSSMYSRHDVLMKNVIHLPVLELNSLKVGFEIYPEFFRSSKRVHKVKFHCKYKSRLPVYANSKKKALLDKPEHQSSEIDDISKLPEKLKKKWKLVVEDLKQSREKLPFMTESMFELSLEQEALQIVLEKEIK